MEAHRDFIYVAACLRQTERLKRSLAALAARSTKEKSK
jgi:hypothetical protein